MQQTLQMIQKGRFIKHNKFQLQNHIQILTHFLEDFAFFSKPFPFVAIM